MHALSFVGITELYAASVCLFWIKTQQEDNIEEFCNPKREKETEVTHHVPKHSLDDIPEKYWRKVDELTKFDAHLYEHAVHRFILEWNYLTQEYKLKLCDYEFFSSYISCWEWRMEQIMIMIFLSLLASNVN